MSGWVQDEFDDPVDGRIVTYRATVDLTQRSQILSWLDLQNAHVLLGAMRWQCQASQRVANHTVFKVEFPLRAGPQLMVLFKTTFGGL